MDPVIDLDDSSNSNSKFDHSDYSTDTGEGTPGTPGGTKPLTHKIATAIKKLTQNDNMKFMENFDPERSNREKRKLTRKIYSGGFISGRRGEARRDADGGDFMASSAASDRDQRRRKQTNLYDEKGVIMTLEKDLCDCLEEACPGCHFPCPKCRSCKCGHECRQNRKWMYDTIEVEGTEDVIRNKFR